MTDVPMLPVRPDYLKKALGSERAAFVANHPFLFLFGIVELRQPRLPGHAVTVQRGDEEVTDVGQVESTAEQEHSPSALVLPLQKVNRAFANMITIGRAPNNDLVIPDVSVSKFHGHFRVPPEGIVPDRGRVELCDAASSNGTWVGARRLIPKEATLIQVGELLRFGAVALTLVDAAQLWDRAHEQPRRLEPPTTG